ncbi:MAG: hypothetical protein V7K14_26525 [Nostoc sp.]|uniref:hypothetical protein n=1 Tax=Nostoc sp. TaxID=1180 RepID=UPI002FF94872
MKVFNFYKISLASVFVATPLCVLSLKVLAQTPQPQALSLQEPAFIIDSGSTNTCPFTISVLPLGKVTYTICNSKGAGGIKVKTAMKFFNDILAAKPLSKLPVYDLCVKSASFGTSIEVKYQGQTSPDISCPGQNSKVINLESDVYSIENELNLSTTRILPILIPPLIPPCSGFTPVFCEVPEAPASHSMCCKGFTNPNYEGFF